MTQTLLAKMRIKEAVPKEDIQSELAEMTSHLASLKAEFEELQVMINATQDAIKVRQEYLSSLESRSFARSIITATPDLTATIQRGKKRSPMEILRSEYKGMKLGHIAAKVLNDKRSPLTTTELTRIIYDAGSDDEFDRARNSLSAELRVGAKSQSPKWRKVGRYAYTAL